MDNLNFKISSTLNTFYKATGIKAAFSDTNLTFMTCSTEKKATYDFSILGMSEIFTYLAKSFSSPPVNNSDFYTYFLPNNFIFNISFLINNESYIGAFVTEPMLVKSLNKKEIEKLLCYSKLSLKDKKALENLVLKIPVVHYDEIKPIGNVLHCLSKTIFEPEVHQILRGSGIKSKTNTSNLKINKSYNFSILPLKKSNTKFTYFTDITTLIKNGDTESLIKTLDKINVGKPWDSNLSDLDFIRALKNNFIKICSMACCIAIEAKAPYERIMNITDTYICKVENLQSINGIYNLIKEALISITNIIAKSLRNSYSKYVNNAMNYIDQHYAEKISLEMLAKYTNLSTYYLSKQIKKETGLNLLDNVNNIRIEKSKHLLLNTNISILDIAQKVGFNYQNHFAAVFKKFTGISPNEFRKTLGHKESLNKDTCSSDKFSKPLIKKIYIKLSMFSNLFDTARIINPINHNFILVKSKDNENIIGKCSNFKNQNNHCENCIFITAYLQNETIFKIYDKHKEIFLSAAIPVTSGKITYIVEVLKNVSNKISINVNEKNREHCFLNVKEDFLINKNAALTIPHSRIYINKKLNINMRSSALYKKSLSIILFTLENLSSITNSLPYSTDDFLINTLSHIISNSLLSSKDWVGHYTKNIFLLALNDIDCNAAIGTAKKIKEKFNFTILHRNKEYSQFTLNYGIASYSDDITDSEAFIKQAFMNIAK